MATEPASIKKMIAWQKAHLGDLNYSQRDAHRLSSDTANLLKPTDCSGLVARMFKHFAGLNVGTYTGNECNYGSLVTRSKGAASDGYGLLPGDVVFFNWSGHNPTWDHVAMYAGGGRILNHGGPGRGPNNWSLSQSVGWAAEVMVRRFIAWPSGTVTRPPVKAPGGKPSPNPMHGHAIPGLIARGTGDYYGLITGPNESHGGANASERPAVKLIQQFLNYKMDAKLKVDGKYGATTKNAVTAFQHKYMKGTDFYGQVWYDDWAKMASL